MWSKYGSRDSPTSICTTASPPDDHSIDTVGGAVDEMLAEVAEDVMMSSCISWEAPSLEDSLGEGAVDCGGGGRGHASCGGGHRKSVPRPPPLLPPPRGVCVCVCV